MEKHYSVSSVKHFNSLIFVSLVICKFDNLTVFLYEVLIHKCHLVRVWGIVNVSLGKWFIPGIRKRRYKMIQESVCLPQDVRQCRYMIVTRDKVTLKLFLKNKLK